jgi:hypothetical protein
MFILMILLIIDSNHTTNRKVEMYNLEFNSFKKCEDAGKEFKKTTEATSDWVFKHKVIFTCTPK